MGDEASVDMHQQHADMYCNEPLNVQPLKVQCGQTVSSDPEVPRSVSDMSVSDTMGSDTPETGESASANSSSPVGSPKDADQSSIEELNRKVNTLTVHSDTATSSPSSSSKGPEEYQLKWITWHEHKTPIVTQNQNGPCPLIAIANILLLRGKIKVSQNASSITAEELITHVANNIVESRPENTSEEVMRNFEQNMQDAVSLLPQLHTGLDVNVKFTGVNHFEFTEACTVFDLLNISLYHGWVVDPQAVETISAVGNLSYNQLVELIIQDKMTSDSNKVTRALLAEQFLESSASQLTYHGLCELNSVMADNELAVLFRNNHFSTIYKRRVRSRNDDASRRAHANIPEITLNELFVLATDQGFLHEHTVVWEMLCNIEGDCMFVDSNFNTVPPKASSGFSPVIKDNLTEAQQIDHDYMVALALQEDMKRLEESWEDVKKAHPDEDLSEMSDEELARWFQKREVEEAEEEKKTDKQQVSKGSTQAVTQPACSCGSSSNVANEERRMNNPPSCAACNTGNRSANSSGSPTTSHKKNTCSVL